MGLLKLRHEFEFKSTKLEICSDRDEDKNLEFIFFQTGDWCEHVRKKHMNFPF